MAGGGGGLGTASQSQEQWRATVVGPALEQGLEESEVAREGEWREGEWQGPWRDWATAGGS